jgi:hypothetical protein
MKSCNTKRASGTPTGRREARRCHSTSPSTRRKLVVRWAGASQPGHKYRTRSSARKTCCRKEETHANLALPAVGASFAGFATVDHLWQQSVDVWPKQHWPIKEIQETI